MDSTGKGYDGATVHGQPIWDADGKFGGCLDFDETYSFVIPKDVFNSINKAITISVWVNGNENQMNHSGVILQAGIGERGKPYILTVNTKWQESGRLKWRTGYDKIGYEEVDDVRFNAALEQWAGRWNHYAFVKDANKSF